MYLPSLLALVLAMSFTPKKDRVETVATLDDLNRALTVVAMHEGTSSPSTNELAKDFLL